MGGTFVVSTAVFAAVVGIIIVIEKMKHIEKIFDLNFSLNMILAYTSSYYTVYMYDEGDVFLR